MTRTKIYCTSVETTVFTTVVKFCAAWDGSDESKAFTEAMPTVNVEMDIRDAAIAGRFKPGQRYQLELHEAK